jgi:hypothetical protein
MSVFTGFEMLGTFLDEQINEARESLEGLRDSSFSRATMDELAANVCGLYAVEPLELQTNDVTLVSTTPTKVGITDRTGAVVRSRELMATFRIPYVGAEVLWKKVPEDEATVMRHGDDPLNAFDVGGADHLVLRFRVTDMEPYEVKNMRTDLIGYLEARVDWANAKVVKFDRELRRAVLGAIEQRVRLLEAAKALDEASDVPLYRVPDEEQIPIPLERKQMRPESAPTVHSGGSTTHHIMAPHIYEDVVQTIEQMTRAMERTPTAAKLDEEEIRNLILFVLNANYRGAAAGEVFNGHGKTDILLRWEDDNAFIGECKFWHGPAAFVDAVNQLHRYVTWRDTKAALIIFIRGGNATEIMEKARKELRDHATFERELPNATDTRSDFILHSTTDPDRLVSVALVGVIIPQKP